MPPALQRPPQGPAPWSEPDLTAPKSQTTPSSTVAEQGRVRPPNADMSKLLAGSFPAVPQHQTTTLMGAPLYRSASALGFGNSRVSEKVGEKGRGGAL